MSLYVAADGFAGTVYGPTVVLHVRASGGSALALIDEEEADILDGSGRSACMRSGRGSEASTDCSSAPGRGSRGGRADVDASVALLVARLSVQ